MLTKDLVRFRRSKDKVRPSFIQTTKSENLRLATALVGIFEKAQGKTRGELGEAVSEIIASTDGPDLVARGLEKLLLDRTQFDEPDDETMMAWRHQVFLNVNQLLSDGTDGSYQHFENTLARVLDEPVDRLKSKLYSDLPEFLPATRFRSITPTNLLHRYNCALVQWLLLNARKLEIVLAHQDTSHLRQLCKYLRFHQLLANIHQESGGVYRIEIDGPMSLFHKSQKYGLSLARFFPALLQQPVWRMQAEIALTKRPRYQLELDHQSGLKPYSHHFHAYIPREIQRFEASFGEKATDWALTSASQFLPLPGEQLCFPDYSLTHQDGAAVALEFFHPWHASPLKARLRQVKSLSPAPLILGVSRKLAKDEAIAKLLDKSDYFQNWGLKFSEIPAVRPFQKLLAKWLETKGH